MNLWPSEKPMWRSVPSFLWLGALGLTMSLSAQVPDTDIWLFSLKKKDKRYTAVEPQNITKRPGYDNQPAFTADGKSLLYVSIRADGQSDVYRYDLKSGLHSNLTRSKVSEFAPTLLPDGTGFSVVVVEADSAQRVWNMAFDGSFMRFASDITDSVGYHAWLNADTMLYYKLTEPHSLHALDIKTGRDVRICEHPARAFAAIAGSSSFMYAIKQEKTLEFRLYRPATRSSRVYATYPSLNEDFIWHPEFGLVKSEQADLLRFDERSGQWEILFSFTGKGIKKITRFAFDPKNKFLVIVDHP